MKFENFFFNFSLFFVKGMYGCNLCGKHYSSPRSLKEHGYTHGPADHRCAACGKAFKVRKYLKEHEVKTFKQKALN